MKFGVFFFADASPSRQGGLYRLLLEAARYADENGFEAIWTPERHFHAFGGPYANPSVTSAAISAITSRIRVRAGSVVAPLHHPIRIAEEWSMVDNLSNGRAGIALASGWNAVDFAFRPEAYLDRARVVRDTLAQVRALWAGEPATVVDGKGEVRQVYLHPRPVQRDLPVWITSAGNAETFASAGRMGAGILTHLIGQDLSELSEKIGVYRQAARDSESAGHVVVMLHTLLGDSREKIRSLARQPMLDYLRSSLDLLSQARRADPDMDPQDLKAVVDELVERAFDRYFEQGGLFGTVADGGRLVEKLRDAGVDEIASLIDFGVPDDVVLDRLTFLAQLKDRYDSPA
jgi:natural product biosynthesis luciferase-like monooxygenase protein